VAGCCFKSKYFTAPYPMILEAASSSSPWRDTWEEREEQRSNGKKERRKDRREGKKREKKTEGKRKEIGRKGLVGE
jgi:hypothetical protein